MQTLVTHVTVSEWCTGAQKAQHQTHIPQRAPFQYHTPKGADGLSMPLAVYRVTLSDEEAKRRKGPKTVIERCAPPTFDVAVEIIDRNTWRVHLDLAAAVDAALKGPPRAPPGGSTFSLATHWRARPK